MPDATPGGNVALVTGASSGFGRAIADALHRRGYRVFGTSRNPAAAAEVDGPALIEMDVDSDASVHDGVAGVLHQAGHIDVLVNNAGLGYAGALEDTTVDEACRQFETNFFGMHRLCRVVLPQMRARGGGRIVNMSSLAGLVTVPFQGMYCASKHAVEAYTQALRMEVKPFGIHVAMVEPGDFATGFTASRRLTASAAGGESAYAEHCRRAVEKMAEDESATTDLGPVVRAVVAAVESRRPRLRYPVASPLQRVLVGLRHALPASVFEHLLMDHYGIR